MYQGSTWALGTLETSQHLWQVLFDFQNYFFTQAQVEGILQAIEDEKKKMQKKNEVIQESRKKVQASKLKLKEQKKQVIHAVEKLYEVEMGIGQKLKELEEVAQVC